MKEEMGFRPKVVELSNLIAGPYCGRLLATAGAEVIKVERPGSGDDSRRLGPFLEDRPNPEASGTFLYLNVDKLGVTIDVTKEDGRRLFLDLVADADVLIEDRPPGELAQLGLGYEALSARNPRLIMVSITPFGQDGPYKDYIAHHLNIYHASGQGYLLPMWSPSRDREPVRGPGFLGEFDAGMSAAIATLAALFWRDRGGQGQHIDISKQHSMLHLERSQLRRYADTGVSPNRTGKGRLLESLVQSKDGDFAVLILSSERQWQGLFAAMGKPDWGAREPFNTQSGRAANHEELHRRLREWAKDLSVEEIFHSVQSNNSACAPVQTAEQLYGSPQIAERNYLTRIVHPVAGELTYPGSPFNLSNAPKRPPSPAPLLGQHNEEIFCTRLNCGSQDLVRLRAADAI